MASLRKKLRAIADPIGSAALHYAGKKSKTVRKWEKRLFSWGYHRKKLTEMLGLKQANSAGAFASSLGDVYGSSGSIVGKM